MQDRLERTCPVQQGGIPRDGMRLSLDRTKTSEGLDFRPVKKPVILADHDAVVALVQNSGQDLLSPLARNIGQRG